MAQEKGPRVFLDYDQAELDAAYDQARYAPNREQLIRRWSSSSAFARTHLGAPERISYGPAPIEQLSLFRAGRQQAPVMIFIHGGAWRSTRAEDYDFQAEMFLRAGVHYVAADFSAVQDTGGSLQPIADQVRRSIAWVCRHAREIGGDPSRIFVSGHSSGGHLAGVALATDWRGAYDLPEDCLRGGVCLSGMYDLLPVSLSARSSYVKFDAESIAALSPMRHLARIRAPLIVAYGTEETPEFQRQGREFATALKAAGKPVELIVARDVGHFEMPENFSHPYASIGRTVLRMIAS